MLPRDEILRGVDRQAGEDVEGRIDEVIPLADLYDGRIGREAGYNWVYRGHACRLRKTDGKSGSNSGGKKNMSGKESGDFGGVSVTLRRAEVYETGFSRFDMTWSNERLRYSWIGEEHGLRKSLIVRLSASVPSPHRPGSSER